MGETAGGRVGGVQRTGSRLTEDECFVVLEGELVLVVDGTTTHVRAGETILAPRRVPHSYRAVSESARWLVITTNGDFERFVREASRPVERAELSPPSGSPTAEQERALAELSLRHRIELLGPPPEIAVAA